MTEAEINAIRQREAARVTQRCRRILECADGKLLQPLARHLAFECDTSADEALELLAVTRASIGKLQVSENPAWASANAPARSSIHVH